MYLVGSRQIGAILVQVLLHYNISDSRENACSDSVPQWLSGVAPDSCDNTNTNVQLRMCSWLSCSIALQHIYMTQPPAAMEFGMCTHKEGKVSPIFLLLLTRWQSVTTEENIASGNAHSSSCSYALKAIIDLISGIYDSLAQILQFCYLLQLLQAYYRSKYSDFLPVCCSNEYC